MRLVAVSILIAMATVTASSLGPDDTWRFPENEQYGYICLRPKTDSTLGSFLIVRHASAGSSNQEPYLVIDSLGSSTPPQLCDSYAFSYTIRENDSAHLVVAYFDHTPRHDTILTYLDDLSKVFPNGRIKMPDNRVFCLSKYRFIAHDSVLVWEGMAGTREFIEIGRIGPTGAYETRQWFMCSWHPSFANDLSHVLFSAYMCGPSPSSEWNTSILAYYAEADTVLLIFHSEASCTNPQRRSDTSDIYCLVGDSTGFGNNLGRLREDSLVLLTQFKAPESISDFFLFRDSIVLFTVTRCEAGGRKWILVEGDKPSIQLSR